MYKEDKEKLKQSLFYDYSWSSKEIEKFSMHIDDVIEATEQVINYTRCSTQLKDNRTQAFWEWAKVNSMQLKDDGVFYKGNTYLISDLYRKWKREIEPNL